MERPKWITGLAIAFELIGILLSLCGMYFIRNAAIPQSGWFRGLGIALDYMVAKMFLIPGAWLIVTGVGIWSMRMWAIYSLRIAGYFALSLSLVAFVLMLAGKHAVQVPIFLIRQLGFGILFLGFFGFLMQAFLFAVGLGLISFSRESDVLVWFRPKGFGRASRGSAGMIF